MFPMTVLCGRGSKPFVGSEKADPHRAMWAWEEVVRTTRWLCIEGVDQTSHHDAQSHLWPTGIELKPSIVLVPDLRASEASGPPE